MKNKLFFSKLNMIILGKEDGQLWFEDRQLFYDRLKNLPCSLYYINLYYRLVNINSIRVKYNIYIPYERSDILAKPIIIIIE